MAGLNDFKINTDQLTAQANKTTDIILKVEKRFETLKEILESTSQYWEGEAGDAYRRLYPGYEDDIIEIFKRLKEHPQDMLHMAGIYDVAERASVDAANVLPVDVI